MKKILVIAFICMVLFTSMAYAQPIENQSNDIYDSFQNVLFDQLSNIDTGSWEPYIKYIGQEGTDILGSSSAKDVISDMLTGNFSFSWNDVLRGALNTLFTELRHNMLLMGKIIVVAALCSIFKNMNDSFNNPSVGEIGYFVCYSIVVILIIQSLISILAVGKAGIEQMVSFMQILFPALLALLVAMGNFASSSLLQPAMGFLVGTISTILKNLMIPLIALSAIITIVNNIGEKIQLQRLGKLLSNLCVWTLTFVFTIFIGVMTIQGLMASSFDGISIRTAKFAIDTFVPIIGKMFSQSVDTIIGCSLLLKNAIGAAGLIIIGLLCLAPGIKILALLSVYKLSSALLEPITDKRIVECLNSIGSILNVLFITVVGIAMMFFITVTLVIGTGNVSVMLR